MPQGLVEKLRPFLLRRTKDDVDLGITPMEETLIHVEITNYQKTTCDAPPCRRTRVCPPDYHEIATRLPRDCHEIVTRLSRDCHGPSATTTRPRSQTTATLNGLLHDRRTNPKEITEIEI